MMSSLAGRCRAPVRCRACPALWSPPRRRSVNARVALEPEKRSRARVGRAGVADGDASDPLLSRGFAHPKFHARGRGVQCRAALAYARHPGAGGRTRRRAVSPRARPQPSDRTRPAHAAADPAMLRQRGEREVAREFDQERASGALEAGALIVDQYRDRAALADRAVAQLPGSRAEVPSRRGGGNTRCAGERRRRPRRRRAAAGRLGAARALDAVH